jgi:hypothetical protein
MSLRSILTVFVPHDKRASVLKGFTLRREEEGSVYISQCPRVLCSANVYVYNCSKYRWVLKRNHFVQQNT